ncbi:MAG: hypothetical protein AAGA87_09265 [Pseudomonadota bacterium]
MADNRATRLIPLWIYGFSALLFLSSLVGIYGGYVNPGVLLAEYAGADWSAPHTRMLAGFWGSKNLAFCIVFVFALLTKRVAWLVPLFAFRFISDGTDMLVLTPLYREASLVEIVLPFLVLGLPSLFAALVLHSRDTPRPAP